MKIFVSYRRSDTPDVSGRIYDELTRHFGAETVFKDVDDIPLGVNFERFLHDTIRQSSVMLLVIGQGWLNVTDERGERRLDQPGDFVRIEVQAALERSLPIVPLLVQGATMPRAGDLPAELATLSLYNGTRIRPDPDFHTDMGRLIRQLEPRVKAAAAQGAAAQPPERVSEDRSAEQQAQLAELYTDARSAYYTDQWPRAIELLRRIVSLQQDYGRAAEMLQEAERQHTLSDRYAQGDAAYAAGQWPEAIEHLQAVVALDAGYRDAASRMQEATRQKRLADLYQDARQLHQAGRWQAVIEVFERIHAIEPDYADPDELLSSARAGAEAEKRAERLAALYDQALAYVDAREWSLAAKDLEQIAQLEPGYRETEALLERARQEAASQERARQLADLYRRALAHMDAGEWPEAEQSLARIAEWAPGYRETEALLARARQEARAQEQARVQAKVPNARTTAAVSPSPPADRATTTTRPVSQRRTWVWIVLGTVVLLLVGSAILWITTSTSVGGKSLRYGKTVYGWVTDVYGDTWTFEGSTGDSVHIYMHSNSMDTFLHLLAPYTGTRGGQVAWNDDQSPGDTNSLISYQLESSGTYIILARGRDGASGPYKLRLWLE